MPQTKPVVERKDSKLSLLERKNSRLFGRKESKKSFSRNASSSRKSFEEISLSENVSPQALSRGSLDPAIAILNQQEKIRPAISDEKIVRKICQAAAKTLKDIQEVFHNTLGATEVDINAKAEWFGGWWRLSNMYLGPCTPLMVAAKENKLEIVRYLVEERNAKVSVQGGREEDYTALDCALTFASKNKKLINYLVSAYIKEFFKKDEHWVIDLSDRQLTENQFISLAEAIKRDDTVTKLVLANNYLSYHSILALQEILENNKSLRELDMSNTGLNKQHMKIVAKSLANNPQIYSLNISNNPQLNNKENKITKYLDELSVAYRRRQNVLEIIFSEELATELESYKMIGNEISEFVQDPPKITGKHHGFKKFFENHKSDVKKIDAEVSEQRKSVLDGPSLGVAENITLGFIADSSYSSSLPKDISPMGSPTLRRLIPGKAS